MSRIEETSVLLAEATEKGLAVEGVALLAVAGQRQAGVGIELEGRLGAAELLPGGFELSEVAAMLEIVFQGEGNAVRQGERGCC